MPSTLGKVIESSKRVSVTHLRFANRPLRETFSPASADEVDKFMGSQTRSEDFAPPLPVLRHCVLATPFDAPQAN
jgi:hypothetical protein